MKERYHSRDRVTYLSVYLAPTTGESPCLLHLTRMLEIKVMNTDKFIETTFKTNVSFRCVDYICYANVQVAPLKQGCFGIVHCLTVFSPEWEMY